MKTTKHYWVYILSSTTGTLYIGVTGDLETRILQHKSKVIKGFTEKYNIDRLIFYEEFQQVEDAINAEKKLKGWTRKKKIELIKQHNPEMKDLFESRDPSLRSG